MISDVPQVMIQTGPNGEDPVIEVRKMGRLNRLSQSKAPIFSDGSF